MGARQPSAPPFSLAARPSAAGDVEWSGMTRAAKGRSTWAVALGLAAVLLAAALPAPASASAPSPSYAETRVRGFELQIPAGVGAERASSPTRTGGYGARYDEQAAGYPLVPRGNVVTRTTRGGDPGVRITRPDGSVIDITPDRVKEFVPEPRARSGIRPVKFDESLPGSKGKKRLPTKEELELLDAHTGGAP